MITMSTYLLQSVLVLLVSAPGALGETAVSAIPSAPAPSTAAVQEEGGVLFRNVGRDTQYVLATFNGDKCGEMSDRAQLELAPGESQTVDSGDSRVCWCASTLGKVGNCSEWSKAKPGKKVTLR